MNFRRLAQPQARGCFGPGNEVLIDEERRPISEPTSHASARSVFGMPASQTQRYRQRIYSMIYLPAGFGSRARGCWFGEEIGPAAGARRAV
jgi:hypothetical protein